MVSLNYTPCKTGESELKSKGDVYYITFPALDAFDEITNAFSTKLGGVSEGMFASMNLGRVAMDSKEKVFENFRIFSDAIGIDYRNIVISDQQHTDNIKILTKEDCGKGLTRDRDYEAIDGFVTNEPGVCMCLLYADCVPVYIYDPVHKAAGLVHSGWKGTKAHISAKAIRMMGEEYGTKAEDVVCVIAPSICKACYQVSEDLLEAFSETFEKAELEEIFETDPSEEGKYKLDLWRANQIVLEDAGVKKENIHTTDVCTCCNSEVLFSHRASKGRRGNLGAFLMINE